MKKLIALILVAFLALALVACGGETESSTPDSSSKDPATSSSTPVSSSDETPDDPDDPDDPDNPDDPDDPDNPDNPDDPDDPDDPEREPLFSEGIDIMNGDYEYMAVNPFWYQGTWPCAFEDQHMALDFNWSLVFTMQESVEGIYEQLIGTDDTLPEGTPNDQTGIVNNQYKWVVTIDEEDYEIERFSILNDRVSGYIRMDLGADFELSEEVGHVYEIVLKIYDVDTGALEFWAWFTDPELCPPFDFEKPAPVVMIPDETVSDEVEALPAGSLSGISGAAGFNASETYVNLFDDMVRTKLCTNDVTTPIIFTISDDIVAPSIKSISLVGANDDASYSTRLVTKFKVYGATSGEDGAAWELLCDVDITGNEGDVVNYGERNYEFTKTSEYRYYKLEIEHATDMYQISEIILYADKGSVAG